MALTWYPEERATAQEMLEHPWLKMPKNEDIKMSDEEYEEMMVGIKDQEQKKKLAEVLKSDTEKKEKSFSEYEESEEERNAGDNELESDSDSDRTLGYGDSDVEREDLFASGYCNGRALNNSFFGPYANMEHIHQDRGRNPQFDEVLK